MRKLLLLLTLLSLSSVSWAGDFPFISYRDSIAVADTSGAGTVTFDTSVTAWTSTQGARSLHFYEVLAPLRGVIDTNFTSDTFFINVQFSIDQLAVTKTVRLDTLLDDASTWTGADCMVADSIAGNYMRAMLIHNTQKRPVASVNKVYGKLLKLYFSIIK